MSRENKKRTFWSGVCWGNGPQIAVMIKRHLHTIIKLPALYHMGCDMPHYYSMHSEFLQAHQKLTHFGFCPCVVPASRPF